MTQYHKVHYMKGLGENCRGILYRTFSAIENEAERFVVSSGQDFTRKRKLPFAETMRTVMIMEGNSLNKELCDIHNISMEKPFITKSAFVQQRAKIKHEAFEEAFRRFNNATDTNDLNLLNGYRLIVIDGSDLNIALNTESDTYFGPEKNGSENGYNQFHINAVYDLLNSTYMDCIIQPTPKKHEIEAARQMIRRIGAKPASCRNLVIGDRGYGFLDLMESIRDANADYLIRIQNTFIKETAALPNEQLDVELSFTIVTKQTKELKALREQGLVKWLSGPSNHSKTKKRVTWHHESPYNMTMRVVRFPLSTREYETIATSLDRNMFPIEKIKEIYHLRWGIETSFRTLKYAIGLTSFHAKKEESIKQEIFARLLMYNFCSRIANSIAIEQKDDNAHTYQVNFTQAIHICFSYMKWNLDSDIRELIRRYVEPCVRGGQTSGR